MKKRVLALLIAAAAAPISATAAPQFYGKLHLSVDTVTDYPVTSVDDLLSDLPTAAANGLPDQWQVQSNSSRIGIRGVDPLNNSDLKAIYQVEVGVDADGDSASTFSTRNTYLGVDTPVGKFFAGKYDSVVKQAELGQDQFNDTVADIENVFFTQRRLSNTLNWVSPSFSSMTVKVQVAPGEGVADANDTKDGLADTLGASVEIKQDAFVGALALERSFFDSVGVGLTDTEALRGTVGLNLGGGMQVGAIVEMLNIDPADSTLDDSDILSWMVSGKLGLGERMDFKAQIGMLDSSDLDAEASIITAGVDYRLGKSTSVYGLVSLSDLEVDQAPAFLVDESGNAVSFGMIHSF